MRSTNSPTQIKKNRSNAICYTAVATLGLLATIALFSQSAVCTAKFDLGLGYDYQHWFVENGRGSNIFRITANQKVPSSFMTDYFNKITAQFSEVSIVPAYNLEFEHLPKTSLGGLWFNACQQVDFYIQGSSRNYFQLFQHIKESFTATKNEQPSPSVGMPIPFYYLLTVVSAAVTAAASLKALNTADKLPGGCRSLFRRKSQVAPAAEDESKNEQSTPTLAVVVQS